MQCAPTIHGAPAKRGNTFIAKFISQSGTAVTDTVAGMLTEMQRCGEAVAIGTGLGASPLRSISNLDRLKNAERVVLVSASINVYDTTLAGGTGQDADTLEAIREMLDPAKAAFSLVDAYMAARYRNTIIGMYQPNFVRPRLRINRKSLAWSDLEQGGGTTNTADLSWGMDIPHCWQINEEFPEAITTVEAWCPAGQVVGEMIQRYMVSMELTFNLDD